MQHYLIDKDISLRNCNYLAQRLASTHLLSYEYLKIKLPVKIGIKIDCYSEIGTDFDVRGEELFTVH